MKNIWTDFSNLKKNQLDLQVAMQFKHHHNFMVNYGLNQCHNIMDLGTGNGNFLATLAKEHPDISFIGVDNHKPMIQLASNLSIENVRWVHGDVSTPKTISGIDNVDGILMRYLLLHIKFSSDLLKDLHSSIQAKTRLWIIDLDLEQYRAYPPNEAFELIIKLVKRYFEEYGRNYNIGSELRCLLKKAGFSSIRQEVESLNTEKTDIKLLQKFIIQEVIAYRNALPGFLTDAELEKIKDFINKLQSSDTFVNYGVTMTTAMS